MMLECRFWKHPTSSLEQKPKASRNAEHDDEDTILSPDMQDHGPALLVRRRRARLLGAAEPSVDDAVGAGARGGVVGRARGLLGGLDGGGVDAGGLLGAARGGGAAGVGAAGVVAAVLDALVVGLGAEEVGDGLGVLGGVGGATGGADAAEV